MLLVLVCLLAAAAAAPATYDQRQDGEVNVQADVQNIVILLAVPKKVPSIFDMLTRSHRPADKEPGLQDRADVQIMEAFVEPNEPYHVNIGSERSVDERRAVEIVIAGRRRMDTDQPEPDEYKLLGATEQCGPDRVRDPVTLVCKPRPDEESTDEENEELKKTEDEKNKELKKDDTTIDKIESKPTLAPEVIAS